MATLTIHRCDSIAHAEEIKALFLRNDRATFSAFFDRAYPFAVAAGGRSWVARNAEGSIVGHLAAFPRAFRDTTRTAHTVLFTDLLFDREHRNFLSAAQLFRRAIEDLCGAGRFDFAYTDPTPPAQMLVRALGFTQLGTLRRFVASLHPVFVAFFRIRNVVEVLSPERIEGLGDGCVAEALAALQPGPRFRGQRSLALYATRLGGESVPDWRWLLLRRQRDSKAGPVALVLTARQPGEAALSILDVLWDDARVSPASVLHAVARTARDEGCKKLSILTLAESAFARSLERFGFIRRSDALPVVVHANREGTVLPPVRDWLMTYVDGSAW